MCQAVFKSKWVEACVRDVLRKPEGMLEKGDLSKIRYAKAGGDFMGGIVLELSCDLPPEPFAAFDGGDEWAVCLHSETALGRRYRLEDCICADGWFLRNRTGRWEYALSKEAQAAWAAFKPHIAIYHIFDSCSPEELGTMEEDPLPPEDLSLLSGLTVLRLCQTEISTLNWFSSFPNLEVLELAEVDILEKEANVNALSGLKQLALWRD